MPRDLSDAVVVITGASSGIGRTAARLFAERGAAVVLAARREEALGAAAQECRAAGGVALVVPTDVTDERQVQRLAEHAIETFGRIDVWVNNAAVTLFGRFEETPPEAYDRVIHTNLFGYIHGGRAVLPYFREQGEGVLINVASVVGYVGQPYTSAYVTTKHAIRGWAECLRQELIDEPDIHVCTVLPPSVDTPLFQQAANYSGRTPKPMSPVYPVEAVAGAIVRLAERPQREVFVGAIGRMMTLQHALAPGLTERMMARKVEQDHFEDVPAEASAGNLFEPMPQWAAPSGNWLPPRSGGLLAPALIAGAVVVGMPLLYRWWQSNQRALDEA